MIAPSPAVSGLGSKVVKRLTPTTVMSPLSIACSRAVLASTSRDFIQPLSTAATDPPSASISASSARAEAFSASTLAATTGEPSNRSSNSRRSVS